MELKDTEISHKEKQPNNIYTQKRIMAGMVALYCIAGTFVSILPGKLARMIYDKDISELDNEQNAIYEQFMASEEFSDSFKAEFTKVTNDYTNGVISYEEFEEKVKYLNSVKYAQNVLASSKNEELKAKVEVIDQKKEERSEKYNSNLVTKLSLGAMGVGTVASVGSTIASIVYTIKEDNEDKRKRKANNETSIKGIKYYNSTTMTIRNTNGNNQEDEEILTK